MIYGIGTDIVRVSRMQRSLARYGEKFARRLLTFSELADFRRALQPAHFLARRFAAKEAAAKAMGTGFADGLRLRHIGVAHDARGRPELVFDAQAAAWLEARGIRAVHVSIADEQDHAVAFVALETAGDGSPGISE